MAEAARARQLGIAEIEASRGRLSAKASVAIRSRKESERFIGGFKGSMRSCSGRRRTVGTISACGIGFAQPVRSRAESNGGRVQPAAPVFRTIGLPVPIAEILSFAAVIGWALAPRIAIPLLRAALLLYALGITP